jgi:hypothetical protein
MHIFLKLCKHICLIVLSMPFSLLESTKENTSWLWLPDLSSKGISSFDIFLGTILPASTKECLDKCLYLHVFTNLVCSNDYLSALSKSHK